MAHKLFISHSTADDAFVRRLRIALADHGQPGWIDSRELRGGDPLWPVIQQAIQHASAFAVVVSPTSLQSKWVAMELRHALDVQRDRGRAAFPVVPLALDGTRLGAFEPYFDEEPVYIPIRSEAGGVEAAMNAVLVALGVRLPADVPATPQPEAEPLEDLVLELTDLSFHEEDGVRRASARARLVYEPATPGQPVVKSPQPWRFVAPLGPIEAEDLRWYLEEFATWPSDVPVIQNRARAVEANLVAWGRLLHDAAMPAGRTLNVREAWARIEDGADRRFSVFVDPALEAGADDAAVARAREAATLLLGLPWELLHDGDGFLFQGARPVRVRRRLPNTRVLDVPVVATPIRILLVTARPEDEACLYIDHRASALPLVEAMEALPGLVHMHVLRPATLLALSLELDRARKAGVPYHVVHFDGHGVYDRTVGLGELCFERPEDERQLERRRHVTVFTEDTKEGGTGLGALLRQHRVPLVFLEACQTAQAEKASESVATALLNEGVASVVAMSHSVLVETARRFVAAFYGALAEGERVGAAMLAGQKALKDDSFRGLVFGGAELRMEDWFVPVLFQEKADPELFQTIPTPQTRADYQAALAKRLGELPKAPETGFVGRSRELLALERLLGRERYAVVRGQGGEGKTALAAELARWMVRSEQIERAAFVSVETHSHVAAILDALGRQLVGADYSAAAFDDEASAILPIERALREQATLVVMDNLESILAPPWLGTSDVLAKEVHAELAEILALCKKLNDEGETRFVFTSREALPEPFDAAGQRRELHQMDRRDAVQLVERVVETGGAGGAPRDATREEIEDLVDAVHCHARTLALLAPSLRDQGVEATHRSLVALMAEMEARFPDSREKSVFASVALSLERLSATNRDRARVLGVFHGAVDLDMLRHMMQWEPPEVASLAIELVGTGLATPNPYNHLTLSPALCPYLSARLEGAEADELKARWVAAMWAYIRLLVQERDREAKVAATLTLLELPNLFALLDLVQRAGDAEATIDLTTSLYTLLQVLGRPRLLALVARTRDAAANTMGETWNRAQFEAARTRIEEQLGGGRLREALEGARVLLERARAVGEETYEDADYDLAIACFILGRTMQSAGGAEQALPLLDEARRRFEVVEERKPGRGAERMASVCIAEQGECLRALGRLDEAAAAYDERIRGAEKQGDTRGVAVGKTKLGTVRLDQRRYPEALSAFAEAREHFTELEEPGSVAIIWHQTGIVHQRAGESRAAEDAYRRSLAMKVQLGDVAGQASTLNQLGNLYGITNRTEEAVAFYRQAADRNVEARDLAGEGRVRNNLAIALHNLHRHDEARDEILRAIDCNAQFGYASEPWKSWNVLADIERDAGNATAAEEARQKARASYLAYRRDGGENHNPDGRISLAVTQNLLAGDTASAMSLLQQLGADPSWASLLPFIRALEAIAGGSRDRALAGDANLDHTEAAEILLVIEMLERQA